MGREIVLFDRSYYLKFTIPAEPDLLRTVIKAGLIAYHSLTDAGAEEILSKTRKFKILGKVTAGTDRGVFTVGNDAAHLTELVAAGADFAPDTLYDMNFLYVDGGSSDLTGVGLILYLA